jgi:putative PIN family toxin of toxin-antitoxin system
MRITLDTNVLIASFISHGSCAELLEELIENHIIVLSTFILEELRKKLSIKFMLDDETISNFISLLMIKAVMVMPTELPGQVCRDADDDNILGTAIAGECDCLITGDKDLLEIRKYGSFDIIRPDEFWKWEQRPH